MVSRRRGSSKKGAENRAVTPDSAGRDSPRSRKCLHLDNKQGESQPLSEINGWASNSSTKGTPSKRMRLMKDVEPPTPGSPDMFARTPACPSSPGIIPRTPAAAVAGWNYTNLSTPRSVLAGTAASRRSLLVTPQRRHSTANTPRRSSQFVMPEQFRLTPSTMKKEKKTESPEVNLPKIQSKSFYGGSEEKLTEDEEESVKSPTTAPKSKSGTSTQSKPTAKVPAKPLEDLKLLPLRTAFSEPRVKAARPAKRETSATKFRRSFGGSGGAGGGGGVKRKRDAGVNKGGFGHGIKRPKKKQRVNIRVSEMLARSIEIPGSKAATPKTPATPSTPSNSASSKPATAAEATPSGHTTGQTPATPSTSTKATPATPKTGSLAVSGRRDSGVKYELKGGQLKYRKSTPIRRSPRKHMSPMKASYFNGEKPKPPKSRLSGGRLFSPATNYMQPDVMSPEKKVPSPVKRPAPVSPVKFTRVSTDEDDEDDEDSNNISDLINRLGVEEGGDSQLLTTGKTPPPLSKNTLDTSGLELNLQSGDLAAMTINTGGGFVDLDAEMTAYNAVQDILGTMQQDSLANTTDESMVESATNDAGDDGAKLFPIFYKETAQADSVMSPMQDKNKGRKTYVCKDPRQLVLDAGQDRGPTLCLTCGAVYTKGNPEDESSHQKTHNQMKEKLKFLGWRKERKCDEDLDGRTLIVQPGDAKHMWNKVHDVLSIVDRDLGFADPGRIRKPDQSKVFLYVSEKQVVGFLLAETIDSGFRIIPQTDDESAKTYTCSTEAEACKLGVSRIWVHHDFRKKGIATKLADSARNFFILGKVIQKDELAFSDPTMSGMEFAASYAKKRDFLVYR